MTTDAKKFITALSAFLLPLLIGFAYVEYRMQGYPTNSSVKRKYLEENLDRTEILILGNSHALMGLEPAALSRPAFNLAELSQDLVLDVQLFEKYLPRMPGLKAVIFTLSWHSPGFLSSEGDSVVLHDEVVNAFRLRGERPFYELLDPKRYSLFFLLGPSKAREVLAGHLDNPQLLGFDRQGWLPGRGTIATAMREPGFTIRATTFKRENNPANVSTTFAALEHAFYLLRKRNIQPIVVTAPLPEGERRDLDLKTWRRRQLELSRMFARYSVTYLDFLEDGRFEYHDFLDDHLNSAGARKLTLLVNGEIEKALLRGRQSTPN